MNQLAKLTLSQARHLLQSGDLCPVDYAEALLSRIDAHNGAIHAVRDIAAEAAISTAKALKKRTGRRGELPLFGIPFLVKDIMDVKGSVTTCQSRASDGRVANKNADCVQRLKDCGGIYLGKTALYEFALGGPDFDEPWPPARNPWNPTYTPGSSSSGSGAAIAAGFAPLALGTDTGGSIRSPAMMNGVVGLKPTFDRLSTKGVFPLAPSMDTVGPMARTLEDVGVAFQCLDGNPDGGIPELASPPRFALLDHLWREDLVADNDIVSHFETAMSDLEHMGSVLTHERVASTHTFNTVGWVTLFAEAFEIHKDRLKQSPERFGSTLREMLLRGAHISAGDYIQAQHLRRELSKFIDAALEGVDALILPVSALPPCPLEDRSAMDNLSATSVRIMCNVTGHPALALPIGLSSKGLPVGVQIIGRKHDDRQLIAIGTWVQKTLTGWSAGRTPDISATPSQEQTHQSGSRGPLTTQNPRRHRIDSP